MGKPRFPSDGILMIATPWLINKNADSWRTGSMQ